VLLEDDNGKAIALGSHPLKGAWPREGWTQIREACNRRPSEQTIDKYNEYSRTLRAWHRRTFVPENMRARSGSTSRQKNQRDRLRSSTTQADGSEHQEDNEISQIVFLPSIRDILLTLESSSGGQAPSEKSAATPQSSPIHAAEPSTA